MPGIGCGQLFSGRDVEDQVAEGGLETVLSAARSVESDTPVESEVEAIEAKHGDANRGALDLRVVQRESKALGLASSACLGSQSP